MTFQEFEQEVKKHILIRDPYILKLISAISVSAFCEQFDPVWAVIVAPSGGGKSALTEPLGSLERLYELDDLTSNTLISGMKKADGTQTSLMGTWRDSGTKMIVTKDFTNFLSKDSKDIRTILGQLRQVYDGKLSKVFGNGSGTVGVSLKIGWLGCCTSSWYSMVKEYGSMGERFFTYEMIIPDQKEVGRLIMRRTGVEWREACNQAYNRYLGDLTHGCTNNVSIEPFDTETEEMINDVANFAVHCRTAVERSFRNEIIQAHLKEAVGRMLSTMITMARCLRYINFVDTGKNELTQLDKNLLVRLMMTSIPQARRTVLFSLAGFGGRAEFRSINDQGIASKDALDDLTAINVLKRVPTGGQRYEWVIGLEYLDILKRWRSVMGDTVVEIEEEVPEQEVPGDGGEGVDILDAFNLIKQYELE